ncbi:hypothetical protein ACIBG8_46105 [Nonomuraea sp. NPDC050556]|uniref:hypothetical protein n=1 Tax=Nonomuraea sp. NPDC050556 TaxID=3364369 RepID=UPI0037992D9F
MGEFIDAVLSFPAVVFSFLLVIVVAYWLLVIFGLTDLDDDLPWLGLGGVPAGVSVSLMVALAWFFSLAGGALSLPGLLVLPVAVFAGWLGARLIALPLRRLFPNTRQPSRHDFVGLHCVIRTGQASTDFGQAEVTAADGSTAIVQVRTTGTDHLKSGDNALIFEYDADGEFFFVMPYEREH